MTFKATKDQEELLDYSIDYQSILELSDPPDSLVSSIWTTSTSVQTTDLIIEPPGIFTQLQEFLLPDGSFFLLPDGVSHLLLPDPGITEGRYATVWVSGGGRLGTFHKLINNVVTAGGRTYERTIQVEIRNK